MSKRTERMTLGERISRSATPEVLVIAGMILFWLLALLMLAPSLITLAVVLVIGMVAAGFLWLAAESGSTAIHWLFTAVFGLTSGILSVAVFGALMGLSGLGLGLGLAAASTVSVLELLHLHNLYLRNSRVDSEVRVRAFSWLAGIFLVSIVLAIFTTNLARGLPVSWLFVPLAGVALFVGVVVLALGPVIGTGGRSGGRWAPAKRLPPAPAGVDPLVAQAKAATQFQDGANKPPAPTRDSTRF